jgi:hypothetical protein
MERKVARDSAHRAEYVLRPSFILFYSIYLALFFTVVCIHPLEPE